MDRQGEEKIDPKATKSNQKEHRPERTCIACRRKDHPSAFFRVSNQRTQGPVLIESGAAPGRSAYLCRSIECVENGLAKGKLARSLKTAISAEQTEAIKKELICKLQK